MKSALMFAIALVVAAAAAPGCVTDLGEDTANVTDCDGAYTDTHGYCRAPNGRFASGACCATAACELDGAYTDTHGYCRAPNGRFAPEACCATAACEFDAVAVLEQQGIDEIQALFPEDEVCPQATEYDGDVTFEAALDAAIESFVFDDDDIESPLALLADVDPADDTVCPDGTNSDRVRCYLGRNSSRLAITYRDGEVHDNVYPAEYRESIEDNWVFFLYVPELSDHLHWAVVQRFRSFEGDVMVSNYGFN